MKNPDIQPGLESSHQASERIGPMVGQVARLHNKEYSGRGRRGQNSEKPDRRKAALLWSILFGGGAIVVIGVVISLWLMPRIFSGDAKVTQDQSSLESNVRVESRFPSPTREQAIDLVTRALANRDPEKVESLFRVSSLRPSEVVEYFKGLAELEGPVERYDWLSSMDVNGLLVEGVLVVFKGKDKPCERLALLTPDSTGRWRMDFEAFARSVKPSWNKLLEKGGAQRATVRVLVAHDVYYNGPFSDDKQWVCFGMASPDTEQLLRGYCRVGSSLAIAMEKLFVDGAAAGRATLDIQRVEDGGPFQFEITQLLGQDWIVADPIDDKK
jgi:hypothetical protein